MRRPRARVRYRAGCNLGYLGEFLACVHSWRMLQTTHIFSPSLVDSQAMKIVITCYPVYGGSGGVSTELGKALAARCHEVHFIAYSMPFRFCLCRLIISFQSICFNIY